MSEWPPTCASNATYRRWLSLGLSSWIGGLKVVVLLLQGCHTSKCRNGLRMFPANKGCLGCTFWRQPACSGLRAGDQIVPACLSNEWKASPSWTMEDTLRSTSQAGSPKAYTTDLPGTLVRFEMPSKAPQVIFAEVANW